MTNDYTVKKKIYKYIIITYVLIILSFIIFPFRYQDISSQLVGYTLVIPILITTINVRLLKKQLIELGVLIPIFSIILSCIMLYNLYRYKEAGYIIFIFYMLKIPLFYFLSLSIFELLNKLHIKQFALLPFFSVIIFILFVIFQISSQDFYTWSNLNFTPMNVLQIKEFNHGGHYLRYLGWNGFLFASHAISFIFSALCLSFIRKITNPSPLTSFLSISLEIICVMLALISGRSAQPLVLIYLISNIIYAKSIRNILKLIVLYVIVFFCFFAALLNTETGYQTINWMAEPILSSLEHKKIHSNSLNELNNTYSTFKVQEVNRQHSILGYGFYSKDNNDYSPHHLPISDSGIIRYINASGYLGLGIYILIWIIFYIKPIRQKSYKYNKPLQILYFIIVFYSIIFFYKSEWLYQNFYLFTYFSIYHLLNRYYKEVTY